MLCRAIILSRSLSLALSLSLSLFLSLFLSLSLSLSLSLVLSLSLSLSLSVNYTCHPIDQSAVSATEKMHVLIDRAISFGLRRLICLVLAQRLTA